MNNYNPKNWKMVTTPDYDIVIIGPGSEPTEQGGIALIQDAVFSAFQKANAKLITAAAPDLLQVCEDELEEIESIIIDHKGPKNNIDGTWQTLTAKLERLKSVIKKARGIEE